jgi:hypothetical protein
VRRETIIGLGIALISGCLAIGGSASGADRAADPAVKGTETGTKTLVRRLADLRRERRNRIREAALLTEIALFEEDSALGRSLETAILAVEAGRPPVGIKAVEVRTRGEIARDLAGRGEGSTFRTELSIVEEEIRRVEGRQAAGHRHRTESTRAIRTGVRRPQGSFR